jgi:hypothetical protein
LLSIAETLEQNNRQPMRFTLELADEGQEPVHPLNPLQKLQSVVRQFEGLKDDEENQGKSESWYPFESL